MYEQHAAELQLLVTNFRKKNIDLRKDRYEGAAENGKLCEPFGGFLNTYLQAASRKTRYFGTRKYAYTISRFRSQNVI